VLKISRTEIRHSNMLGWLLDPNENHGIGDACLKGILQRLVENDCDGRYDVFGILLMDTYSFSVYREWRNIDILLLSEEEKVLVAIENKIRSHEHSDQLNRYRTILEKEYPDYRRIYVFLTPDGEEPSDVENWDVLTYGDIVEVLEDVSHRCSLQPDVELLIRNYIEVVRRDIVEDEQLIEICNKIYNKHKKALDLILDNRTDINTQISNAIEKTLKKLGREGTIIHDNWAELNFATENMEELLPPLPEEKSAWSTSNVYAYWIDVSEGRFRAVLGFSGVNLSDDEMETMQEIIDILKPGDKRRDNFRTKRIFRTKWYDLNDAEDIEAAAEKAVRAAVDEILEMERQLLRKID
jgi:hypothetical protein